MDKVHNVKAIFGNGLRPDVWLVFKERFAIPTICEFYGSTEGVFGLQLVSHGGFGNVFMGRGIVR